MRIVWRSLLLIDDVFGHTGSFRPQVVSLRKLYCRVRATNLPLKHSKCVVGYTDVADLVFLGLRRNTHDHFFLQFCWILASVLPNFAAIVVSLIHLTKNGTLIIVDLWSDAQHHAFSTVH